LLAYVVCAYAWTWSFNLVTILAQRDIVSVPMPFIVLDIAAGLGPLVAALVVTSYEAGRAGRGALLRQLSRWRVPGRWAGCDLVSGLRGQRDGSRDHLHLALTPPAGRTDFRHGGPGKPWQNATDVERAREV
jgi:hypothetical protein